MIPVQIFTFRRFRVVLDGADLDLTGRPAMLLQCIVAHGSGCVRREAVTRDLLPDKDAESGKGALEIALHRLRCALRHEGVVELSGGILRLNDRVAWADVAALENLLAPLDADLAQQRFTCDEIRGLAWNALRLYKGEFLESEPRYPWTVPIRTRLHYKFLRAIVVAGEILERGGRLDTAIEVYEAALERDAFAETLYRRLIVCLRTGGHAAEAIRAYRRCEQNLRVIGCKPSSATRAASRASIRR